LPFLEIANSIGLSNVAVTKILGDMPKSGQVELDGKFEDAPALVVRLKCGP